MKKYTPTQAKEKILHYCAYQERSHYEVRNKLYEYGLYSSEVEPLLSYLITEGFLNEERFARAFIGGKFRMKKWGKIKILHELHVHNISKNCLKAGLKEITDEDYHRTLKELLAKKRDLLQGEENEFARRDKLAKYVIQKGYEPELVWKCIKELEV
jgi:regulatory protein